MKRGNQASAASTWPEGSLCIEGRNFPARSEQPGNDMYTHPHISSQIISVRQRDRLARAQQQRLARRLRSLTRTAGRASQPEPQPRRALRTALLRTLIPPMTWQRARTGEHQVPRSEPKPQA